MSDNKELDNEEVGNEEVDLEELTLSEETSVLPQEQKTTPTRTDIQYQISQMKKMFVQVDGIWKKYNSSQERNEAKRERKQRENT